MCFKVDPFGQREFPYLLGLQVGMIPMTLYFYLKEISMTSLVTMANGFLFGVGFIVAALVMKVVFL